MKWKLYQVTAFPKEGRPTIIEAPTPGIAIEYYLAIHGMFGYDDMSCKEIVIDEPKEKVLQIIKPKKGQTFENMAEGLNFHHWWKEK